MKKIEDKKAVEETKVVEQTGPRPFEGYTLQELKYQRALIALRKEFCKAKVIETVDQLRPARHRDSSKSTSKFALAGRIAGKVLGNLNTIDYILMGVSAFGTLKKGYQMLRGKRK